MNVSSDDEKLTLCDFFAGQALEGLVHYASASKGQLEDRFGLNQTGEDWIVRTARQAYKIADAMLAVRDERK